MKLQFSPASYCSGLAYWKKKVAYKLDNQQIPGPEFNLLDYLLPVLACWKYLIVLAVISGAGFWYMMGEKSDVYEAFATVTIVDQKDMGGVAPDERRAPEVITLVEHGFVMGSMSDNALQVTLARMRSRVFTTHFIEKQGLQQVMNAQHWNSEKGEWAAGFKPSIGADRKHFVENVRTIEHNPENDVITIRMKWADPQLVRDWANAYVSTFNEYMRDQAMDEVNRRVAFLESQLKDNDLVELDKSIYRLLEAQTAVAMLASSKQHFAIEAMDPAIMPFERSNKSPKTLGVMGGVAVALLACFLIMLRVLLLKMKSEFDVVLAARNESSLPPANTDESA